MFSTHATRRAREGGRSSACSSATIGAWTVWAALGPRWPCSPRNRTLRASRRSAGSSATALFALAGGLVAIALIDVPYQYWRFHRELRMSREEAAPGNARDGRRSAAQGAHPRAAAPGLAPPHDVRGADGDGHRHQPDALRGRARLARRADARAARRRQGRRPDRAAHPGDRRGARRSAARGAAARARAARARRARRGDSADALRRGRAGARVGATSFGAASDEGTPAPGVPEALDMPHELDPLHGKPDADGATP